MFWTFCPTFKPKLVLSLISNEALFESSEFLSHWTIYLKVFSENRAWILELFLKCCLLFLPLSFLFVGVLFSFCVGMYAMRFYNKWILRKQAFYYSSLQISIKLINELHYRYSWHYFSYSFTPVCLSHMFSSNKSSIMLSFVSLCLTILCPLSHLGVRMADWLCAYGSYTMGVVSARWR